jgi:hypothetical protein
LKGGLSPVEGPLFVRFGAFCEMSRLFPHGVGAADYQPRPNQPENALLLAVSMNDSS